MINKIKNKLLAISPNKAMYSFGVLAGSLILGCLLYWSAKSFILETQLKVANKKLQTLSTQIENISKDRDQIKKDADSKIAAANYSAEVARKQAAKAGGQTAIPKKDPEETVTVAEYNALATQFELRELELLSVIDGFQEALTSVEEANKALLAERQISDKLINTQNQKIVVLESSLQKQSELTKIEKQKNKLYRNTSIGLTVLVGILLL